MRGAGRECLRSRSYVNSSSRWPSRTILAGLRTSLVLAVGTATLCFLVSAGGLGILIDTGYKLRDNVTLVVGAVLAVSLALLIDWLGALAETYLGPKGLR